MTSKVLIQYLEEVSKYGGFTRPSADIPNLLKVSDALEILTRMRESSLAIVGGDIWGLDGQSRYEIQSDWFAQKAVDEPAQQFVRRSVDEALRQLSTVSKKLKNEGLVDLVVRDGLTGEPLSREV